MATVGIRKQLEFATAGNTLKVVLNDVRGPIGIEKVLQLAGTFIQDQGLAFNQLKESKSKLQILAGLYEALAFQKLFAAWASSHLTSFALSGQPGSHAEGAGVMLHKWHR
jgi:hypothetical protein